MNKSWNTRTSVERREDKEAGLGITLEERRGEMRRGEEANEAGFECTRLEGQKDAR